MKKLAELAIASKYVRVSDSDEGFRFAKSKLLVPKVYPFWHFHRNSIYVGDFEIAKVLDFTKKDRLTGAIAYLHYCLLGLSDRFIQFYHTSITCVLTV